MAHFLDTLLIREIDGDDRRWILEEPCEYFLGQADGPEYVCAPAGFITDFGSIPQALWNLPGLSPFGKYRRAYVVHDWLYTTRRIERTVTVEERAGGRLQAAVVRCCGRAEADHILREAMQVLGASWVVRNAVVGAGVHVGGWRAWNAHRADDVARGIEGDEC